MRSINCQILKMATRWNPLSTISTIILFWITVTFCLLSLRFQTHELVEEDITVDFWKLPIQQRKREVNQTFGNGTCQSMTRIVYLKMRKCASSSIQNIIMRFAYSHHISVALPKDGHHFNPGKIVPETLRTSNNRYDIFALHTKFNNTFIEELTYPDAIWMTSLRNPVDVFDSMFEYFWWPKRLNNTLMNILSRPRQQLNGGLFKSARAKSPINSMAEYLGYKRLSKMGIRNMLRNVDQLFDLILIIEHLDESLILMRYKLCWSIDDIVVVEKNTRTEEYRNKFSDSLKEKVRGINSIDVKLYEYFLAKHRKSVEEFGIEKMAQEVKQLEIRRNEIMQMCGYKKLPGSSEELGQEFVSKRVFSFKTSATSTDFFTCSFFALPEKILVNFIRSNQQLLVESSLLA